MGSLRYVDHRQDPQAWATSLGVSLEAVQLLQDSDVIDLHIDSFIWARMGVYDLRKHHGAGLLNARYWRQVDFPRIREASVTGGIWSITTSPLATASRRAKVFSRNQTLLKKLFGSVDDEFALVRTLSEYRAARAAGKHGAFVGIQGGNALDRDLDALDLIEDDLVIRITLVHLYSSRLGETSTPVRGARGSGLTDYGRDYVRRLNEKRIFVDLAHIHRKAFADVVEVHDKSQPLIATHTGVCGVYPSWRNLDDDQLRAIADTGGTVGVIFHGGFLGPGYWGGGKAAWIVDHLEHIADTVGEDHASLGSDWDGAIITPRDLPTCCEMPRLVQIMLDRGFSDDRIRKMLGGNYLRALGDLRP